MAKKTAKPKKHIQLRYIADPGHGWAEVPSVLCKAIGLGTDFTERNGVLYLEEDCEMSDLDRALKKHGYKPEYVEMYVDDFDQWLGGDVWPQIPKESETHG
jgi:hypothetical protein